MASQKGTLYLIPAPIHEQGLETLSPKVINVIHALDYFLVERARTARRLISATKPFKQIDDLHIEEMPEGEMSKRDIDGLLKPLLEGNDMGMMSEAGLPAIADPGNKYVFAAQRLGIKVLPLAGPSSIMLALMASGLEGQRFAFHGYLSAKKNELPAQLRHLDQRASIDDATQIWMETPYRNRQILEAVERNVDPQRHFCIAAGIGEESGFVITRTVAEWKKTGWPEIHKIPAVFLMH
jgi:16S rRNA (cytidine1402-2'-O)-methyltransferase